MWFLCSGAVGFGMGDLAMMQALPRLGSRLSVMMVHCLAAPIAALFEWTWLGTLVAWQQLLCGLIILLGVALALTPQRAPRARPTHRLGGAGFGLLAALGQGGGAVLSRKANLVADMAGTGVDGMTAAYQRVLAGVLLSALVFASTRWRWSGVRAADSPAWRRDPSRRGRAWAWLLANALAGPTLGVSCFQWALSSTPTAVVLPIVATTPLVVIPLAMIVERERPARRSVAGSLVAVLGAIVLVILRQQATST